MKLVPGTLKAAGVSVKGDAGEILRERFHIRPNVERCIFVPTFNDFLGGRPVNSKMIEGKHAGDGLGPLLRSGAVNLDEAEVHLLDGTYLCRVRQLRAFG
jgi:metallophosphoesterase superfamily enzyme